MSSVHISDLTSRAGSPQDSSWEWCQVCGITWAALSHSVTNKTTTQQRAAVSQSVSLLGNTLAQLWHLAKTWPMTALGMGKAAAIAAEWGWSWCRAQKESGCDQGASAVCTEILTAHLTKATVLAKVEEQIPVRVITFPNEFPCNFNQLLLTFPPQRVIPPHKPSEPAWRGMRGAKISRAGSALLRTGGQLPTRSFGDFTISPSAAALASPPSPLKAENFTLWIYSQWEMSCEESSGLRLTSLSLT